MYWRTVVRIVASGTLVLTLGVGTRQVTAARHSPVAGLDQTFTCFIQGFPDVPDQTAAFSAAPLTPGGTGTLVCRFYDPTPPAQTIIYENFPCVGAPVPATRPRLVVTPSGQVTLTCHITGAP